MMDMRELVRRLWGLPRSRSGEIAWYECPRHEDKRPSCAIYFDHLHCFSCGWHAFPVSFLIQEQGYSKAVALAVIGDKYTWARPTKRPQSYHPSGMALGQDMGLRLKFKIPLPPSLEWQEELAKPMCRAAQYLDQDVGKRGRVWLEQRGITPEVWREYGLGWQPEWMKLSFDSPVPGLTGTGAWLAEGLVIPVYKDGVLWSVAVRTVSGRPKYLRVKHGARSVLFGLDQLQGHDTLVLTESELDALTVKSVGGVDVLAMRGVKNRLEGWRDYFLSFSRVIVCFDGDDAGQVAASILLEDNPSWENREPPEGKDIGDLVVEWLAEELRDWLLTGISL